MSINFPHYEDLPLQKPPLAQVICQVRFHPILSIVEKPPARFQENIRQVFPKLEMRSVLMDKELPGSGIALTEFGFKADDDSAEVSLGINFIALVEKRYTHWHTFAKKLKDVYDAFSETHGQITPERIGLRFINNLTMANTSSEDLDQLLGCLRPELSCLIKTEAWSEAKGLISQINLEQNAENMTLRLVHDSSPQPHVILDYDYFSDKAIPEVLTSDLLVEITNHFHLVIYDAFRWSLSDKALQAFNPDVREG